MGAAHGQRPGQPGAGDLEHDQNRFGWITADRLECWINFGNRSRRLLAAGRLRTAIVVGDFTCEDGKAGPGVFLGAHFGRYVLSLCNGSKGEIR